MTAVERDEQVRLLLKKYRAVIEGLYTPEGVWLFGSRATGGASP